ncbi:MAG: hypothetical protein U0Y68_23620 [Blastocatellia bacterium]
MSCISTFVFRPGLTPLQIKAEVDKVVWELNELHLNCILNNSRFARTRRPKLTNTIMWLKRLAWSSTVFGKEVETIYELWYSNAPPLNAMGAKPSITARRASRRIKGLTLSDKDREYVNVQDLYDCAKVYALVALDASARRRAQKCARWPGREAR